MNINYIKTIYSSPRWLASGMFSNSNGEALSERWCRYFFIAISLFWTDSSWFNVAVVWSLTSFLKKNLLQRTMMIATRLMIYAEYSILTLWVEVKLYWILTFWIDCKLCCEDVNSLSCVAYWSDIIDWLMSLMILCFKNCWCVNFIISPRLLYEDHNVEMEWWPDI